MAFSSEQLGAANLPFTTLDRNPGASERLPGQLIFWMVTQI